MALILLTPPPVEPVSLAELKEFLRIDIGDTSQDTTLQSHLATARDWVEVETQRRLVQQTWRLLMDFFPGYVDQKLVGQKVSSPFVSGANAVLVGIRYAILLPFPPVSQILDFQYQNQNGQVSGMITTPVAIASVANVFGQPLLVTTSVPMGLQTGAGIVIAGNTSLLAFLAGQQFQNITVQGPNQFLLNGTVGDGTTSIAGGGTATGYNFVYDLQSNPARLTPVFGQMWPVARVVVNAVQVDYKCGYAMPLFVTSASAPSPNITNSSGYVFQASDVGRPISIWGAGPNGATLNTVIASISAPPDSAAVLRDPASTAITNAQALLVNAPNANPSHWEKAKAGIKIFAEGVWRRVSPDVYMKQARTVIYSMSDKRL